MRTMWIICLSLFAAHAYYKADKYGYLDELLEAALYQSGEPQQVSGTGPGVPPASGSAERSGRDETYIAGALD